MKEFKYTIDGKEYKVQIDAVEGNIASVNLNLVFFSVNCIFKLFHFYYIMV